jgi:hypothetical protein
MMPPAWYAPKQHLSTGPATHEVVAIGLLRVLESVLIDGFDLFAAGVGRGVAPVR